VANKTIREIEIMAHAIQVIYTIKDNKGKLATCTVKVPTGLTVEDYVEFAQEMGTLVVNMTTGQIVNVGVAITVDILPGWPTEPGLTSDVEEKGSMQYMAAGNWRTGVKLPTLSELLVTDGSDNLDLADAAVLAFNNAMIDGINLPVGLVLVAPTDARENQIESLVFAREVFRASGKRN
jgi:hypothetical protein